MKQNIKHLKDQNRFAVNVEGHDAYVEYIMREGSVDIVRTYVPKPIKGRGIASELVAAAYFWAVSEGLGCKATCPYAAAWLEKHSV